MCTALLIVPFQCGWYWGPMSGDVAERLLSSEPNGSFLVRDSSDDHYIFSLTFKLNGKVRHVRIEHDQGEIIAVRNGVCSLHKRLLMLLKLLVFLDMP